MNSYQYQPNVTEEYRSSMGNPHRVVEPQRLEQFKAAIESHINTLTYEMQTLKQRADWIEPRFDEYLRFMDWLADAHPDIIKAYKASIKVSDRLDMANNEGVTA